MEPPVNVNEKPKAKKFINLFIPYQKQDAELQLKQNDLILKNTKWAIWLGVLAIAAQLLEVIVSLLK